MEIKKFIQKLEQELNYLVKMYSIDLDDIPLTKKERDNTLTQYSYQLDCIKKLINKFKKEHNI